MWQRDWTPQLRESIAEHTARFSRIVALNAEVVWGKNVPRVITVPLDHSALHATGRPIGLALRITAFTGSFDADGPAARYLAGVAASLIDKANSNQLQVSELQIDFDCAESKLDGYRTWVEVIKRRISPTAVVITALPSWLHQNSFPALAQAADGYVLQVHSLERPKSPDSSNSFSICDSAAAKKAVARASELGIPFRVALPTYGYLVAFSPEGRFIGLSAEGPAKTWPADARIREVRSDPAQLAELVAYWNANRPAALSKIIWYRLPISLDTLNWSWPTFSAVMTGRAPRSSVRAEATRSNTGLVEINLVNDGEADISSRPAVEVRWQKGRLVASDGQRGFQVLDSGSNALQFQTKTNLTRDRLLPGQRQVIGWMRFDTEVEVQVEIKNL